MENIAIYFIFTAREQLENLGSKGRYRKSQATECKLLYEDETLGIAL